jgi:hypothetical protein
VPPPISPAKFKKQQQMSDDMPTLMSFESFDAKNFKKITLFKFDYKNSPNRHTVKIIPDKKFTTQNIEHQNGLMGYESSTRFTIGFLQPENNSTPDMSIIPPAKYRYKAFRP